MSRDGPRRYAEGTAVSPEKSLEEIRGHMRRWKAEGLFYAEDPDTGNVDLGFRLAGKLYRFPLPMPRRATFKTDVQYQAEVRRRWRVLAGFTKALLYGIEEGVMPVEQALLPYAVLQGGMTLAEMLKDGSLNKMLALPAGATS